MQIIIIAIMEENFVVTHKIENRRNKYGKQTN